MTYILIADHPARLPFTVDIDEQNIGDATIAVASIESDQGGYINAQFLINVDSSEVIRLHRDSDGAGKSTWFTGNSISISDFMVHTTSIDSDVTTSSIQTFSSADSSQAFSVVANNIDSDENNNIVSKPNFLFRKSDNSIRRIVYHNSSWQTVSDTTSEIGILTPDSWWFDSN